MGLTPEFCTRGVIFDLKFAKGVRANTLSVDTRALIGDGNVNGRGEIETRRLT